MASEIEKAWAAGLFEGEGSVRINKHTKKNRGALLVDIANTDEQLVRFFLVRWGGVITQYAAIEQRRGYWRWRCASTMAARFLTDIAPYIQSDDKRARIALGLEYQSQKSKLQRVNRSNDYRIRQTLYYDRMRILNLRGIQR